MKQDKQIETSEDLSLIEAWIGQLLTCEKKNGKTFRAKLVAIRGDKLFFESEKGHLMMDKIDHLQFIGPAEAYKDRKDFLESMDTAYQEQLQAEVKIEAVHRAGSDKLSDEEYEELARIRKGI